MAFARELPHSFSEALRVAREILSSNSKLVLEKRVDTEAEQLVAGAFRLTRASGEPFGRTELFLRLNDRYPETAGEKILVLAAQRAQGIPLQHLLGFQHFLEHEYEVSSEVLVPRPETEVLVAVAAERLAKQEPKLGLEIGLGSGVISIELLARFRGLNMLASEASPAALEVAKKNAARILGSTVSRLQTRLARSPQEVLGALNGGQLADFLISNPPYLDPSDLIDPEVLEHEPKLALFPEGGDSLRFYREIAQSSPALLKPGGWCFLELADTRAGEIRALFERAGWTGLELVKDLTGRQRVLMGRFGGKG